MLSPLDDLPESPNEFLGCERIGVVGLRCAVADVVDALEHHQPLHARLAEDVAVEPRERVDAGEVGAVGQHPVSADTLIDDRHVGRGFVRGQAGRQNCRPRVVCIWRRARAVGD